MTEPIDDPRTEHEQVRGDPDRIDLDALAPREAVLATLPALGRRAAAARAVGLPQTARWFVPLAAAIALAAWIAGSRRSPVSGSDLSLAVGGTSALRTSAALATGAAP